MYFSQITALNLFKFSQTDACYIFGYGSEKVSGDPTLDLRLAPVNIIPYDTCLKELGSSNAPERNSGMFCAVGANPGVDACSVSWENT